MGTAELGGARGWWCFLALPHGERKDTTMVKIERIPMKADSLEGDSIISFEQEREHEIVLGEVKIALRYLAYGNTIKIERVE